MKKHSALSIGPVLPLVFLVGCSASSSPEVSPDAQGAYYVNDCSVLTEAIEQIGPPTGQVVDGIVISGDDAPIISVGPEAIPATSLSITDLRPGNGPSAVLGDTITVNYCGVGQSTGSIFDSSWASGMPATFPLEQGRLIQGWVEGVPGMQIGERRLLVIPSELGYGSQSVGSIQPNETLIFVVELISIDN